jgi:hypothetical protein
MVTFGDGYTFDTPSGPRTLLDLLDGRGQSVVHLREGEDHTLYGRQEDSSAGWPRHPTYG